jgi:hypothetical protein
MLFNPNSDRILPIVLLWMSVTMPINVLEILRLSAAPDSAELFLFTPIEHPIALLHGARKAALVFLVLPLFLYAFAIAAWACRAHPAHLWILAPALCLIPPMSLIPGLRGDYIPLSQASRAGERSAQVLALILSLIPAGLVSVIVYFAEKAGFLAVALAFICAAAIAVHFALRRWIEHRARFALRR